MENKTVESNHCGAGSQSGGKKNLAQKYSEIKNYFKKRDNKYTNNKSENCDMKSVNKTVVLQTAMSKNHGQMFSDNTDLCP